VRSPQADRLAGLLAAQGAAAGADADGALSVTGMTAPAVGDLAARHGIAVHELVACQPSLEQAFMELTRDAVDYRPPAAGQAARP
jgi:ABC-2 type transport system ATP-binding protein